MAFTSSPGTLRKFSRWEDPWWPMPMRPSRTRSMAGAANNVAGAAPGAWAASAAADESTAALNPAPRVVFRNSRRSGLSNMDGLLPACRGRCGSAKCHIPRRTRPAPGSVGSRSSRSALLPHSELHIPGSRSAIRTRVGRQSVLYLSTIGSMRRRGAPATALATATATALAPSRRVSRRTPRRRTAGRG
jgi:hypothetical protein